MLEEPIFKKCCYFVPLRVCLQVWAWFKVIVDLIVSLYIFAGLLMFWMTYEYDSISGYSHEYFFIVVLVSVIVDLIFVAVLIAGIFKKRYSFLRIFFFYGVYMILAEAILISVFLFLALYKSPPRHWDGLGLCCVIFTLIGISWIAIDISILVTLKSEMIKIRNKEQYDFARIMNTTLVPDPPTVQEKYAEKTFEENSGKPESFGEKYIKLLDCN